MTNDRLQEVAEICEAIKSELTLTIDSQNGVELVERLSRLVALLPLSAFNVALTETIFNEKTAAVVKTSNESNATRLKMIVNGDCAREIFFKTYAEAQAKELHYSIEATRTMISYLKTEMNNFNTSSTT
jgi:hypothetical protein